MSLMIGAGPFGQAPAGAFGFTPPAGVLYLERSPRRVRAVIAGQTLVDCRRAMVLHESGRLPVYYFAPEDVRADLLEPGGTGPGSPLRGAERRWSVRVGGRVERDAVWSHPEPGPASPPGLAGLMALRWDAMDEWWEEDARVHGHLRDPFHRIDVMPTSRHVVVALGGRVLAESRRALALFEAALPPRWYLPREDVRMDLLEPIDLVTRCAYKGLASYWSAHGPAGPERAFAWTYEDPAREVEPIRGRIAVFNERADIVLDGEPQERPITPFSHPDWMSRRP